MNRRWVVVRATTLLYALVACADATAPPEEAAQAVIARAPTAAELSGLEPEFSNPTGIGRFDLDLAFQPGRVVASAHMQYYANWAKLSLTLTLLRDGRTVTSTTAVEARSYYLPWLRTVSASTFLPVPTECGHSATANGVGEIRNEALVKLGSILRWGDQTTTRTNSAEQPRCADSCTAPPGEGGTKPAMSQVPETASFECTEGNAGGGGGTTSGGYWIAVSTTHCYGYHYYDGNGRYLHSVITHCETTTSYYFQAA